MTRKVAATLTLILLLSTIPLPVSAGGPVTRVKGSRVLVVADGVRSGHIPDYWDLTEGDLTITFTYDGTGLVDDYGAAAHAWAQLGVRSPGDPDFNPGAAAGGSGVWLATDYDWSEDTFDPDPFGAPSFDLDDKLLLQKAEGQGEAAYDLPAVPPNPWANHRFWWDRDDVDPYQNDETANTGGLYAVQIRLQATSDTAGKAYVRINGLDQGFETDGDWSTIELTPAGMTFTGDMERLQVFYGLRGYGARHKVAFRDIVITGTLYDR